jgi:hypothetical protein
MAQYGVNGLCNQGAIRRPQLGMFTKKSLQLHVSRGGQRKDNSERFDKGVELSGSK